MSSALLGLALLAGPTWAEPAPLVLRADKIEVVDDVIRGEGHVRAAIFGGEVEAERFEVGLDGAGLEVEDGAWRGPAGRLSFAQLAVGPDGGVRLDGVRLTRCACEKTPPWEVQAHRVWVDPDRRLVFVGGLVRVAGCPLLPLPAGAFSLDPRRPHLMAPEVAWTRDGLEVGEPVFLPLGQAADLTLTPTWRQARGARLGGALRWTGLEGGGGQAAATGGWDAADGHWRGLATGTHGAQQGALRTAFDGSLASDPSYVEDYAPDFLARQVGFHEARALVALGPWRLDHDGFQDPAGTAQRLAGLSFTRTARDDAALSPSVALDLEVGGRGPDRLDLDEAWAVLRGTAGLDAARPVGVLESSARMGVGGLLVEPVAVDGGPTGRAAALGRIEAGGRLALPMWGEYGSLRHLLRPGLALGGALTSPIPVDQGTPALPTGPAWWVGPEVESRWLSSRGVPLHVRATLPWTDAGLGPALQAWGTRGAWWGRALGSATWLPAEGLSTGIGLLEAGRHGESLDTSLGLIALQDSRDAAQATARLAWRLPWGADSWRPRVGARFSLRDGQPIAGEVGLTFASRCGCLGMDLGATLAEDLEWPGVRLGVSFGR